MSSDLAGLAAREQSAPAPGRANVLDSLDSWGILPSVAIMLRERAEKGMRTYGRPLESHNGRDADRDMREELLDAIAYGWQLHMEGGQMSEATGDALFVLRRVVHVLEGTSGGRI